MRYLSHEKKKNKYLLLGNRKMQKFESLAESNHVEILYAHNNILNSIADIVAFKNLTHAYLQWNRINSITNIRNLPSLQNLYLGFNCITTVEGLEKMPSLKVLHLQKQKFDTPEDTLKFDCNTVKAISPSLLELNVSGNNLKSLVPLCSLHELKLLDVSHNMLCNVEETYHVISQFKNIQTLDVRDNPFMWTNKKWEYDIISRCINLESLNSKTILRSTRSFLRTLRRNQNQRRKLKELKTIVQCGSNADQLPSTVQAIACQSFLLDHKKLQ